MVVDMVSIKTGKISVNNLKRKNEGNFKEQNSRAWIDNKPALVEFYQIFSGSPPQLFGHGTQNVFVDTTSHLRGTQAQPQSRPP